MSRLSIAVCHRLSGLHDGQGSFLLAQEGETSSVGRFLGIIRRHHSIRSLHLLEANDHGPSYYQKHGKEAVIPGACLMEMNSCVKQQRLSDSHDQHPSCYLIQGSFKLIMA
jgi:hypothetical protein